MKDYWVGVITGISCSFLLLAVLIMVTQHHWREQQAKITELQERLERVEDIEEENKTVMQTYKFFNQSWQAIIDLHNHEKEELEK